MKQNTMKYVPGQGPPMPERCAETGAGYLMGGPFWAEPLHDPAWLAGLIEMVDVRALSLFRSLWAQVFGIWGDGGNTA